MIVPVPEGVRDPPPPRVPISAQATATGCGLALVIAGAARLWQAPMSWDERVYYEPAIRFFAERVPRVPLDYPAPSPPLAFVLQGVMYRMTGSFAAVRALSTFAAIAVLLILAAWVGNRPRGSLIVLMTAAFAPMSVYAFSLKQHWFTLLGLACGFVLWKRERHWAAAVALLIAVGTNQLAVAFILMIIARQLIRHAPVIAYALPLVALGMLVLYWQGPQPAMFRVAGATNQPAFLRPVWPQLLLLAFVCGGWIIPFFESWWRRAVWMLPVALIAAPLLRLSGVMAIPPEQGGRIYERAVGPLLDTIRFVARTEIVAIAITAIVIAIGCSIFLLQQDEDVATVRVYAATWGVTMLPVPFLFESYYAFFVVGSWIVLSRRLSESRSFPVAVAQIGAIAFGLLYAFVKL